jgi:hypothetical protein
VVTRSNEISPFLGPLSVSYMSRSPRQSAKTYQLERYRPDHGGPIDTREHGIEFIIFDPDHHPAPYRKLPSVTAHKHCQREPRSGETVDDYWGAERTHANKWKYQHHQDCPSEEVLLGKQQTSPSIETIDMPRDVNGRHDSNQ